MIAGCGYVADCVDMVSAKLALAEECAARGIPLISAMGCGNKRDPTRFRVADIQETSVCPLCRVMRRELKKRGIPHLTVVYSDEPPMTPDRGAAGDLPAEGKHALPGSPVLCALGGRAGAGGGDYPADRRNRRVR